MLLPWVSLRRWLMAVLLCGGLWLPDAAGTARAGEPESGTATLTAIGDLGQPLFALPSLDGATSDLAQHRGRMVLVHFFATWCEPCRPEMARLRELQFRLDGRPIAIVAPKWRRMTFASISAPARKVNRIAPNPAR